MKTLTVLTLAATLAATAAFAQPIEINDDGWNYITPRADVGMTVDVDDDGWSQLPTVFVSTMTAPVETGVCSQLELSLNVNCGELSKNELVKRHFDADD